MQRPTALATLLLAAACGDDGRETSGDSLVTGLTGATAPTSPTAVTGITTLPDDPTTTGDAGTEATGTPDTSGPPPDTGLPGDECDGDEDCPVGQHCGAFSGQCLPEGGCAVSEDCDGGQQCVGGQCEIGGCGAQSFELTKVVPNVMIVLDRSGSMSGDVQDSSKSRWEVAKDAIAQLVTQFDAEIRFGLVTYSACKFLEECTAGEIVVPVGNLPAGPINGFLSGKGLEYLCNSGMPETSTGNTLAALVGEPSIQDPARGNAVLLITDGNENEECQSNTNAAAAAGALFAQAISVRTFAVGFADGVLGSLADVATMGGTVQPYNANNPQSLQDALAAIAGAVASCTFVLDGAPPDPNDLYVFFDDDPAGIPMDPTNGWTYDPVAGTITFHGAACEALQSGAVADLDVVFGCDVPVPG
jgi:hypothetical protein